MTLGEQLEKLRAQDLRDQRDEFHEALTAIACWSEGDEVWGKFDEPGSAKVARAALAKFFIGPCPHGRDPYTRCDDCCDLPADVVMARRIALDAKEKR